MKKPERKYNKRRLKEYRKLLMSDKVWDFDFSSLMEVEKLQLNRIAKSITRGTYKHVGWKEDVKWIKLTIKLIDLILNEGWWDIDSNGVYILPKVNLRNKERFINKTDGFSPQVLIKLNLYEEKLWNLYNKIKQYKMRRWWI